MVCVAPKCNTTKKGECSTPNAWAMYLRMHSGKGLTSDQLKSGYKHWKSNVLKLSPDTTRAQKNLILCKHVLDSPMPKNVTTKKTTKTKKQKKYLTKEQRERLKRLDGNRTQRRNDAKIAVKIKAGEREKTLERERADLERRVAERLIRINFQMGILRNARALKEAERTLRQAKAMKNKSDKRIKKQALKLKKRKKEIKKQEKIAKEKTEKLRKLLELVKKRKEQAVLRRSLDHMHRSIQEARAIARREREILEHQRAHARLQAGVVSSLQRRFRRGLDEDTSNSRSTRQRVGDLERETRITDDANDTLQLSTGNDCGISPEDLGEYHFNRFDKLPFRMIDGQKENNCQYLARTLDISGNVMPISYITKGSQNVVFKGTGLGYSSGAIRAIRVGKIGSYPNIAEYEFNYSTITHHMAHDRLGECGIDTPQLHLDGKPMIGNTKAGVQVFDFVNGITFCDQFEKVSFPEKVSLCKKLGRTIGIMHHCARFVHGDANGANFMINDENKNSNTLVVLDLDKSIDLNHITSEESIVAKKYDLTRVFSTLFFLTMKFAKKNFPSGEIRDMQLAISIKNIFEAFSEKYLEPQNVQLSNIWEKVPHSNQKNRQDVSGGEFLRYVNVLRSAQDSVLSS